MTKQTCSAVRCSTFRSNKNRFVFCQVHNCLEVPFTYNGTYFPILKTLALFGAQSRLEWE
jgi:hypothetical protein